MAPGLVYLEIELGRQFWFISRFVCDALRAQRLLAWGAVCSQTRQSRAPVLLSQTLPQRRRLVTYVCLALSWFTSLIWCFLFIWLVSQT